jgi:hypothetical protein
MANAICWYYTSLPEEIVTIIENDVKSFEDSYQTSVISDQGKIPEIRNSENTWIPAYHWITGYLWYYIQKTNLNNFRYDITEIDSNSLQLTKYDKNQYYHWHTDYSISSYVDPEMPYYKGTSTERAEKHSELQSELVRKLSFSLQLSNKEDYKGGQLQLMHEGRSFFAPKQRGTLIVFDSRLMHRVRPVTEGVRKSIVGWVVGPRWR